MKGIILAGGSGSRLYPITRVTSKQLLPVYDKPMIYYPLSTLMLAGLRDILIITTPRDQNSFQTLLGNGTQLGIRLSYVAQDKPRGLADAFLVGEEFLQGDSACLILGDNIFYSEGFTSMLLEAAHLQDGALIFGYYVKNPSEYGVVTLGQDQRPVELEEKPASPKSHYAIPGLYFYDHNVVNLAKRLRPSARGELEITDLNRKYLSLGKLDFRLLGRGMAWLDTGTPESLIQAGQFINTVEQRQGLKIGCIEEVAYRKGFIQQAHLQELAKPMAHTEYGQYLLRILEE